VVISDGMDGRTNGLDDAGKARQRYIWMSSRHYQINHTVCVCREEKCSTPLLPRHFYCHACLAQSIVLLIRKHLCRLLRIQISTSCACESEFSNCAEN
jgi:hypothetical protein